MYAYYIIKKDFYHIIKKNKNMIYWMKEIEIKQRAFIFQDINIQEIYEASQRYFDGCIEINNQELTLCDRMNKKVYTIRIEGICILVEDKNSPFIELLNRKYPFSILVSVNEQ